MKLTIQKLYPKGDGGSFNESRHRRGTVYCPLCSTSTDATLRKKIRCKRLKIPKGLASHFNEKHTIETMMTKRIDGNEIEHEKRFVLESLNDLVKRWTKYTSSVKSLSFRTMPADVRGCFLRRWIQRNDRKMTWEEYCIRLVRAVEESVDDSQGRRRDYASTLPPLHALAAEPSSTWSDFDERLNDMDKGNKEIRLKYLLAGDRNGSTCLHWAGGTGRCEFVDRIIEEIRRLDDSTLSTYSKSVASKSTRGRDGRTFVHFAARHGRTTLIDRVLTHPKVYAPFYPEGVGADAPGNEGTTPLMLAAYGGHLETTRYLVEIRAADVRRRNKWGCSVAHFCALRSSLDMTNMIRYLYRRGVDFTAQQSNGHTPIHKACLKGNSETVRCIFNIMNEAQRLLIARSRDQDGKRPSEVWTTTTKERDSASTDFVRWLTSIGW